MTSADHLDARRTRLYGVMLLLLLAFLALIIAEVARPAWACGMWGFPASIMGGNPFLAAVTAMALLVAILLAVVEAGIDRAGVRDVVDDERRVIHRLKAWRNAYFGAVLTLFAFVILADRSTAIDMPFVLGGVMVGGAIALFATMLFLGRE